MSCPLQLGFDRRVITPPLGMQMEGLLQKGGIEAIHDDLYVRTLFLQQDGERLLILALDLLFFDRAVSDRLVGAVGRRTGLCPRQILLNFSHTHAGPRTSEWHYSGAPDPAWLKVVESRILEATIAAIGNLEPVTCSTAATETRLPVSRRRIDAAGQAQWAPDPDGPVCNHLPATLFRRMDGSVKSIVISASCHPSIIYLSEVSAEFPGVAVRELNRLYDTQGAIYLQGAAGDTKPRQVAGADRWVPGNWESMQEAGKELADAVAALPDTAWKPVKPSLHTIMFEIEFPLGDATDPAILQELQTDANDKARWARDMLKRLALDGTLPAAAPITLHGIRLGANLRMIALEAEPVAEIGLLILDHYRDDGVTMPLGYSNGCQIYLPVDRQLAEHGYEVDSYWEYHWPAPLAPGIDAALEDALTKLDALWRPTSIAMHPAAAPVTTPR